MRYFALCSFLASMELRDLFVLSQTSLVVLSSGDTPAMDDVIGDNNNFVAIPQDATQPTAWRALQW